MRRYRRQREAERLQRLRRAREAVSQAARGYPGVRRVFLFKSLVKPRRFQSSSDTDVTIEPDTPEAESALWRTMARKLGRDVDVRPLTGGMAETVAHEGELVRG